MVEISVDKDHFHTLFKTKPTLNIRRYVKTITSREI
ncbi:transposase [Sulfolobus tengchongensis]|uniref:Transposase n=1 Tax=Sulfolobus tengchongensis TaxID=207809 RepID=A0AAX4L645_9CREN